MRKSFPREFSEWKSRRSRAGATFFDSLLLRLRPRLAQRWGFPPSPILLGPPCGAKPRSGSDRELEAGMRKSEK